VTDTAWTYLLRIHGSMATVGVVGQFRDQLRKWLRRVMGKASGAVATVIDSHPGASSTDGRSTLLRVDRCDLLKQIGSLMAFVQG
jgi:hypothetical protein